MNSRKVAQVRSQSVSQNCQRSMFRKTNSQRACVLCKKVNKQFAKKIVLPAEIFPSARCSEDKLDELLAEKKNAMDPRMLAKTIRYPVDFLDEYIFAKKCFSR